MANETVIVCVKSGRMYHACYANILHDMVRRNLPGDCPFTFHCFTDDAAGLAEGIAARPLPGDLEGWWNKLWLFKAGIFAPDARILYFDLDTLITGPLQPLLACNAEFAPLRDFYRPGGYGSGVMVWKSGECGSIWESYDAAGRPVVAGGDQAWLEYVRPGAPLLQELLPGFFAGYKTDCRPLPPQGTSVVAFHGEPKQDNCGAPWVEELWRIGGPARASGEGREERHARRVRHAATLPYAWISRQPAHDRPVLVAGNGQSLLPTLRGMVGEQDMELFAAGGAAAVLEENAIRFTAHVMRGDGRGQVPKTVVQHYYAATCAPQLFAAAQGEVILWNPADKEFDALSTGLCALHLAFLLGYRTLHLAGFDGCYLNATRRRDEERLQRIVIDGREFTVTPGQIAQGRQFALLADRLVQEKCLLHVYGDGLIPALSRKLAAKEK